MRSRKILTGGLILVTVAIATTLSEPLQTTLTPRQILARMADVYANCSSYRDEGKVVSAFEELSFATIFERPSRFRYEYTRSGPRSDRYVIWRTAPGETQSWWTIRSNSPNQSMNMAIASATGVSAATSHNIPRLLMPDEVTGFSFAL